MNLIRQEHRTGCGIACAAMLSGNTYAEAMSVATKALGWAESQRTFYTSSTQLSKLLSVMNISTKKSRSVRKWSSIPDKAIVAINHNEKSDSWHWVIFCRKENNEYVLDPLSKRDTRTDFKRMRLRSCIPIDLTPL